MRRTSALFAAILTVVLIGTWLAMAVGTSPHRSDVIKGFETVTSTPLWLSWPAMPLAGMLLGLLIWKRNAPFYPWVWALVLLLGLYFAIDLVRKANAAPFYAEGITGDSPGGGSFDPIELGKFLLGNMLRWTLLLLWVPLAWIPPKRLPGVGLQWPALLASILMALTLGYCLYRGAEYMRDYRAKRKAIQERAVGNLPDESEIQAAPG